MATAQQKVLDDAMSLPVEARLELVESLLQSLNVPTNLVQLTTNHFNLARKRHWLASLSGQYQYPEFALSLVRWLAEPTMRERFLAEPVRGVFQNGEEIEFSARVWNEQYAPIPDAQEVALLDIEIKNLGSATISVSPGTFRLTGSLGRLYQRPSLMMENELRGEVEPGQSLTGYLAFLVGRGERNLALAYLPLGSISDAGARWLWADQNPDSGAFATAFVAPTASPRTGGSRADPALMRQPAAADDQLELTVLSVQRDAWPRSQQPRPRPLFRLVDRPVKTWQGLGEQLEQLVGDLFLNTGRREAEGLDGAAQLAVVIGLSGCVQLVGHLVRPSRQNQKG